MWATYFGVKAAEAAMMLLLDSRSRITQAVETFIVTQIFVFLLVEKQDRKLGMWKGHVQ